MNINDELLLKIYLQCGDCDNFKETYTKIKRNFRNIVNKKDFPFHDLLCKNKKNEKNLLSKYDMFSSQCLNEIVLSNNTELFEHLLSNIKDNSLITNIYQNINNLEYAYKEKINFLRILINRGNYDNNFVQSHEEILRNENRLKSFLEDNPNNINSLQYEKYIKTMQNNNFKRFLNLYTDDKMISLPKKERILKCSNDDDIINNLTENFVNDVQSSINLRFNDLEFKFLRVNSILSKMFDFNIFSISNYSINEQVAYNKLSDLHLKSINNLLIENLINKI